ncbi:hypothetical protein ABZS66_27200 [Dactylosporangium sp. NPDC005572]|uniref:hypothetical protein n=1 Tax=Dactylosporangium sp. NPDC005572 TaxID=3156889 RepID=UPI0033ADD421
MTRRKDEYDQPVRVYAPIHGTGMISTDGADVLRIRRSRVMIGDDNTAHERHHYTIERVRIGNVECAAIGTAYRDWILKVLDETVNRSAMANRREGRSSSGLWNR